VLRCQGFDYPLSDSERLLLRDYEDRPVILGVRPENIVPSEGGYAKINVTLNENLGQNTLVHGLIGEKKLTAKVREWCTYKPGDAVSFTFDKVHFFDKETTNAIR
jgi:multiple sugar transport system ATP-binding protein